VNVYLLLCEFFICYFFRWNFHKQNADALHTHTRDNPPVKPSTPSSHTSHTHHTHLLQLVHMRSECARKRGGASHGALAASLALYGLLHDGGNLCDVCDVAREGGNEIRDG
jgi:hypothetical protein